MHGFSWLMLVLFFLILEMLVPGGFFFASLALGALAGAVASFLGSGPIAAWTASFIGTTFAVLLAAPFARRCLGRVPRRPVGFEALVGQRARVTEPIDPVADTGQVQLEQGAVWLAQSDSPIPLGAWVVIRAVSGTRLRVDPLPSTPPDPES